MLEDKASEVLDGYPCSGYALFSYDSVVVVGCEVCSHSDVSETTTLGYDRQRRKYNNRLGRLRSLKRGSPFTSTVGVLDREDKVGQIVCFVTREIKEALDSGLIEDVNTSGVFISLTMLSRLIAEEMIPF